MVNVPRLGHIWTRLSRLDGLRWHGDRLIPFSGGARGDQILTAISAIDPHAARVFTRLGRGSSERAFRAALRHSRSVRLLRFAVPIGALLVLLGSVAFPALVNPVRMLAKMPVDIGSVVVSGTKIMMQQPRIAGFTRDNRRYDLTAQAAGQDVTKPHIVELQGIHATMEMQDDAVFNMTALTGLYDSKTELLKLSNNVVVTSTNGNEAQLAEALLDIRAGKIVSEKPVFVKTSTLSINANRMEVLDSGDVMRFEQGVTVVLSPESSVSYEARSR
jgi:lipopolysaccharide export system protein LptC